MSHAIVDEFLQHSAEEAPKVAKAFGKLNADGQAALATVLSCFDYTHTGNLDDNERALARRVLGFMHRPSVKGMEQLVAVLGYLDVDNNQTLDHQELTLAVEILEMFCKADSVNSTLSTRELEMLRVVLESMDDDGSGTISEAARVRLRDSLWDPNGFIDEQKANNPALQALLK